jgi:hypothetical protein
MDEREKILEMLTRIDDQFTLKIYKRAYHIDDWEIIKKRKELKQKNESGKGSDE